jgi:hypothetical protein
MTTNSTITAPDALARLEAESAINRLLASYVHSLDDGKFAETAELLKHATLEVLGEFTETREAIEQYLVNGVKRHGDGTPRTWHSVSNVLIDLDPSGEKATAASYFTVHQELDGFPLQPICTGRYLDRFEKHDGEWRFAHRLVKARMLGDLHHHVAPVDRSRM